MLKKIGLSFVVSVFFSIIVLLVMIFMPIEIFPCQSKAVVPLAEYGPDMCKGLVFMYNMPPGVSYKTDPLLALSVIMTFLVFVGTFVFSFLAIYLISKKSEK